MRLAGLVLPVLAIGLLAGCGGGSPTAQTSSAAKAKDAPEPWVVVEPGNPTARAGVTKNGSPRPGLPPVSFLPTTSACAIAWPESGQVLIPMIVTPIAGGFEVRWPAAYGPSYRLTAVHQGLVAGAQPEPTWQTVAAGANCTVTATITGLISGDPYIVWLDAPDTPTRGDGSRSLRSGKTGVVKPL
jgi:hypothetical protein